MTAQEILKQYFGYDDFRGGQEALINDILAGRDVLGVMPTGAGKSLCFQIPALMMEGITLIVSPLISLMKDQVNALIQSGVAAAYINSSLTEKQINKAMQNAGNNAYKLIYVAPERLFTNSFLLFARRARIAMLTIDEAHCISQWGHDFRPSYTKIPDFIANLQNRPVISAFTATATPRVREDIIKLLQLNKPTVLETGFDRPNLYFAVQKPKDKFAQLLAFLRDKTERSGIIYCSTRATVEDVCEKLKRNGYKAARYHAGLADEERRDNQDDFIYDRIQIMVATNAFGMGIDKSNVAFVVHYNMPKDIESYYQEAGRAGRDGEAADCLLLYSGQDVRTNLWLIENGRETADAADAVLREAILEHERARLREMTFYCATKDCLRAYILKYFGETPPPYCGNCGNCGAEFTVADISELARKILTCVSQLKGRFGSKMIIDMLRGGKNARIISLGLDKLSTFGVCQQSVGQLRAVIEHLILAGYLIKTDDEFPVLKLGELAGGVLHGGGSVSMKLPVAPQRDASSTKAPAGPKPLNKRLFSILRELRLTIAEEQNLPAFVILHDSTLTDMCLKTPTTQEALLQVSGIGQVKAERYGQRFLEAIKSFLLNSDTHEEPAELPTGFDALAIEISDEPVTVSAVADRINCALLQNGLEKISGRRINDWLAYHDYLQVISENGKNTKIPAPKGAQLGIFSEERIIRGAKAKINLFGRQAQEYIVENSLNILSTGIPTVYK